MQSWWTSFKPAVVIRVGGPENGNFPYLLYVMKISLHTGWVVLKSLETPIRNIKMAPYATDILILKTEITHKLHTVILLH